MKGIVFTEFVEFIEKEFGFDIVDDMIDGAKLESEAIYTQTGNYDYHEMVKMVEVLSKIVNIPSSVLIEKFGVVLFDRLFKMHKSITQHISNPLDFIEKVEKIIHPEVKKLYPDADLPTFDTIYRDENSLKIRYHSKKPFMDLAKGLMIGCGRAFNTELAIDYIVVNSEDNFIVDFDIVIEE
jgi:hypothetical protein